MIDGGLAIVQQVVCGQGDQADGGRIARVAIVLDEPEQQAHRALAHVAVVPVAELGVDENGPIGLDGPVPVEYEMRRRHDRQVLVGPGVAFERFGGDADAEVALAVLSPVPGGDDAVAVLDRRVGEILLGRSRIVRGDVDRRKENNRQDQGTNWAMHRRTLPGFT